MEEEELYKYKITYSSQFKKDYKRFENDEKKIVKIDHTIDLLRQNGQHSIPIQMKPHLLKGNYKGYLECHIESDLLIIWVEIDDDTKEIYLARLGSHSELFGKKK